MTATVQHYQGREELTTDVVANLLLAAGAISILLYIGMDILCSVLYDGYSYRDQTISELSAIGAPTRSVWVPLGVLHTVLVLAFAVGIWRISAGRWTLRAIAICAAGVGLTGVVWPFAPMHQREVLAVGGETFSDTLHLGLGGLNSVLFLISMALGTVVLGKSFRLYTMATIVAVLVFGSLMSLETPAVAENKPTPWLGVYERIAVEGSLLWYAVLAIAQIRRISHGDFETRIAAEKRS